MKFPKPFLLALLEMDRNKPERLLDLDEAPADIPGVLLHSGTTVEVVHTEGGEKVGRWSVGYSFVFRIDARHFMASYTVGATESQDESPFEYEGPEVECPEVRAVPVTTTTWAAIT